MPKNSEELPENKWKDWLEEHKEYLENSQQNDNTQLLDTINKALEKLGKKELTGNDFITIQNEIFNSFSKKNESNIHSIDNLALLGKNDNSSLNNAIFPIKRDKIIEMDKGGKFIPPCTKNVFLKYYTPSEKEQANYWGQEDRDAYKKAIIETLNKYGIKEEK